VADKTAKYVAKNGRAFEVKILNSERGKTPKFAFLHSDSPFHAYYEDQIRYYTENDGEEKEETKKDDKAAADVNVTKSNGAPSVQAGRKKDKKQKASAIDPIAKALLEQRNVLLKARREEEEEEEESSKPPPPPPLEMAAIVAPYHLTATQIETIQLVAQLTAMDGKGGPFLHQLTLREWNNPDFAFCQPRHAHFAYFSALVDAYRKILKDWTSIEKEGTSTATASASPESVLKEVAYRAEYERDLKLQQEQKQQEEGEIVAIDWNDFVVVETIDFPADEMVINLLPPSSTTTLELETNVMSTPAAAAMPKAKDDMDESSDEDEGETIRVVPSYQPKVVGAANLQQTRAIDPITGKSVNIQDMPEHLRIQLLDPKWAEERKKFQEKQKDSNLVGGDAMVANISRLVRDREGSKQVSSAASSFSSTMPPPKRSVETTMGRGSDMAGGSSHPEPVAKRPRMELQLPKTFQTGDASVTVAPPPQPLADPQADTMDEPVMPTEEKALLSEEDFRASLESPNVTLQIKIPNDSTQMAWNFYGQMVTLTVDVTTKVKDVKAQLSQAHLNDMPSNKIVLKDVKGGGGYLSNTVTLAALNIGPTATLEMSLKQRGGRK
jgi:Pre-mRNA splicing factor PRP21 like protein/Surp module